MAAVPTDPRTLLAGGALLVLSVVGGFALGAASEGTAGGASAAAGDIATAADGSSPGDDATTASTPPAAPQADELVPVFLPVAEGTAPPATTSDAAASGPDHTAPPDDTDDTDEPDDTDDTEEPSDGAAGALQPIDFARGYEARGGDTPSLEPAAADAATTDPTVPTDAATTDTADPTAAPTDADGTGTDGGDGTDEPTLVDLCAGDEPVEGCDDGVLGTIWFAASIPVAIDDVAAHRVLPSSCAAGATTLATGEVAVVVTTNQPVALDVSWDYEDGGASGSATGVTDDDQAAAFDRGERESVVTCVAVTGPADQPTTRPTVRIEATSPEGGDPAVWEQPLELGDTVVPGEVTRPERPPLRIEWRGPRQIDAWVPVGPDETALAWLVRRDPDRPSMRRCHAAEDGSLAAPDAIVSPPIGRRALARSPGSDHGFTSSLQFGFTASDAGQHDVCVRWQEGPDPAPVTERAAVQVRVDELPRVEVLLAGASTQAPHPSSITVGVGCGTRTAPVAEFTSADETAPHVLCEQTLGSVVGGRVAIAHRADWGPRPGRTADGVLRILVAGCDPVDLPACTRWYRLPLLGEDGDVRGELTVGLRPVSVPELEWRARTGPEQSYGEPDPGPEHPRLDVGSLVLEPDPSSPTDTLRLRLRTADPADVEARVLVADRRAEGASCATRWPRATATGAQDGATLVFGDLCPGTRYRAVVTVHAPGEAAPAAVYGGDPATHDVPIVPLDATASTAPLQLEVSATLEITHRGGSGPRASYVIPSVVRLRAGPELSSFSQSYLGRARVGLWCGHVQDLGRQIEPTVVDVGAMLPLRAHARLHYWNPQGVPCPGVRAQISQEPAPTSSSSGILPTIPRTHAQDLTLWIDSQSLRPGTSTFETPSDDGRLFRFTVTLTVHETPAASDGAEEP